MGHLDSEEPPELRGSRRKVKQMHVEHRTAVGLPASLVVFGLAFWQMTGWVQDESPGMG